MTVFEDDSLKYKPTSLVILIKLTQLMLVASHLCYYWMAAIRCWRRSSKTTALAGDDIEVFSIIIEHLP
jgi:hypothetical protein